MVRMDIGIPTEWDGSHGNGSSFLATNGNCNKNGNNDYVIGNDITVCV